MCRGKDVGNWSRARLEQGWPSICKFNAYVHQSDIYRTTQWKFHPETTRTKKEMELMEEGCQCQCFDDHGAVNDESMRSGPCSSPHFRIHRANIFESFQLPDDLPAFAAAQAAMTASYHHHNNSPIQPSPPVAHVL
jgi:hypothetical protein